MVERGAVEASAEEAEGDWEVRAALPGLRNKEVTWSESHLRNSIERWGNRKVLEDS